MLHIHRLALNLTSDPWSSLSRRWGNTLSCYDSLPQLAIVRIQKRFHNNSKVSGIIKWLIFSFQEKTLPISFLLSLWIGHAFVCKKTTLTPFQCPLCEPQRKDLIITLCGTTQTAGAILTQRGPFCEYPNFKGQARINSQFPSASFSTPNSWNYFSPEIQ